MKKWLIKYWATLLMYGMFWTTIYMYKSDFKPIWTVLMFAGTCGAARAEGEYRESFKTDFFYKQTMNLLDDLHKLQKTVTK